MKSIKINFKTFLIPVVAALMIMTSCNKELESFPIPSVEVEPPPTGTTIASYISTNSNYSFLDTALRTTGLYTTLLDKPGSYTLYAPSNDAFKGLIFALFNVPLNSPDDAFIGVLKNPAFKSGLTSILLHHIMTGQLTAAQFPTTFPNVAYLSTLRLDPVLPAFAKLFPSARAPYIYVNNVPITSPDLFSGSNGVIQGVPAIVAPPTGTLKTAIAAQPTLSYFRAAIARADSGAVGLSRFDSLLNYGLTNMTVLAPSDDAFKALIYKLAYGSAIAKGDDAVTADAKANLAVAAGPAFLATNNVTTELIKGVMAYHFLAAESGEPDLPYQPIERIFSVNFSPTPTFIKTLVNNAFAVHPGVLAQATFTGPIVSALTFTGLGSLPPATPYSGTPANAIPVPGIGFDRIGVNGVYYIIDQVLLPQ
ncbi:MAG: fasciclin domain-containing protein [Bacteroidota bacterium]